MNRKLLFISVILFAATYSNRCLAQMSCDDKDKMKSIKDCPRDGCKGDQLLNHNKNRTNSPAAAKVEDKTFDFFSKQFDKEPFEWKSNTDRSQFKKDGEGSAIRLEGFLLKVKTYGGKNAKGETCNCNLPNVEDNDYHIAIVEKKDDEEKQSVTGEITPRMRLMPKFSGWTLDKLRKLERDHAKVRLTGWLLFDSEHTKKKAQASPKTAPKRRTSWEIHPITQFEVWDGADWTPLKKWTAKKKHN